MSRQLGLSPEIKKAIRDYNAERGMRYAMNRRLELSVIIGLGIFPFLFAAGRWFADKEVSPWVWSFVILAFALYFYRLGVFERANGRPEVPDILKGAIRDPTE